MEIKIDSEIKRFKGHLELEGNNQTIFSGVFGIGKTHFIKKFFEQHIDEYEAIYLKPVNYSIANNKDISDYIKYDILFELLKKNIELEKTNFQEVLTVQFFIQNNFEKLALLLLENFDLINKNISEVYKALQELKNNFDSYHNKIQIDQFSEIRNFLKKISLKNGSIYEEDSITQLILGIVKQINSDKKTVLVIDDFDRIDPEHIFRLLNVFACHFDYQGYEDNKFGFSKILFICDIDNIRSIFRYRYGIETDFIGYIDKFYSKEIFYYNFKSILIKNIEEIIKSVKIKDDENPYNDSNNVLSSALANILNTMLRTNALNTRTLFKKTVFNLRSYRLNFGFKRLYNIDINIVRIFDFLLNVYPSENELEVAFLKCKTSTTITKFTKDDWILGELLLLLDYNNHLFTESVHDYSIEEVNISYTIKKNFDTYGACVNNITKNVTAIETFNGNINYYSLLHEAFKEFRNIPKLY